MSADATGVALGGILDALTLVQEQLDTLTDSNHRIEAMHKAILTRLDMIDAGQAAVTDLTPILEAILGRSIDDRDITKKQLGTIATAIGFAHAAANACTPCRRRRVPTPQHVVDSFRRVVVARKHRAPAGEPPATGKVAPTGGVLIGRSNDWQGAPLKDARTLDQLVRANVAVNYRSCTDDRAVTHVGTDQHHFGTEPAPKPDTDGLGKGRVSSSSVWARLNTMGPGKDAAERSQCYFAADF